MRLFYTITYTYGHTRRSAILPNDSNRKQLITPVVHPRHNQIVKARGLSPTFLLNLLRNKQKINEERRSRKKQFRLKKWHEIKVNVINGYENADECKKYCTFLCGKILEQNYFWIIMSSLRRLDYNSIQSIDGRTLLLILFRLNLMVTLLNYLWTGSITVEVI